MVNYLKWLLVAIATGITYVNVGIPGIEGALLLAGILIFWTFIAMITIGLDIERKL